MGRGISVDYILNDGGFVSANFTVSDGARALHVKVAEDLEHATRMQRWFRVRELLAERYRAPRAQGWAYIGDRLAMVMEHVSGSPLERPPLALIDAVVPAVDALHRDAELASAIEEPRPLRHQILDYHVRICASDLSESLGATPPPFVDADLIAWMHDEVAVIEQLAHADAFDGNATAPTHGDLWPGNVLSDGDRWWIVDWDELSLGDPAHDLSLLLFTPIDEGARPERWLGPRDLAFHERFRVYMRATLLVGVIDSLADWEDARKAPAHTEAVRARKEAHHRWALSRYRELYG